MLNRWKHGLVITAMLAAVIAAATVVAAVPLMIIAQTTGALYVASAGTVIVATGLVPLPYLLTHPAVAHALRHLLDPRLRDND